jgi:flagellar biosynthesis/type III secretory pathway M-ring protein FliF/YscJ
MPTNNSIRIRNKQFQKELQSKEEREKKKEMKTKKDDNQLGPIIIGLLLFVIVGSALVQLFNKRGI